MAALALLVCAATVAVLPYVPGAEAAPLVLSAPQGTWKLSGDPITEEQVRYHNEKYPKDPVEALPFTEDHIAQLKSIGVLQTTTEDNHELTGHAAIMHHYRDGDRSAYLSYSNGGSVTTTIYKEGKSYHYTGVNPGLPHSCEFYRHSCRDLAGGIFSPARGLLPLNTPNQCDDVTAFQLWDTSSAQFTSVYGSPWASSAPSRAWVRGDVICWCTKTCEELINDAIKPRNCIIKITDPDEAVQWGCRNVAANQNLATGWDELAGPFPTSSGAYNEYTIPTPPPGPSAAAGAARANPDRPWDKPDDLLKDTLVYVENASGEPVVVGDYYFLDFEPAVDPAVFEEDPACRDPEQYEVWCPDGTVIYSPTLPPPRVLTPAPQPTMSLWSAPACSATAPLAQWHPMIMEIADPETVNDGKKWNQNNGGVVDFLLDGYLAAAAERLPGTLWAGSGNVFTHRVRWRYNECPNSVAEKGRGAVSGWVDVHNNGWGCGHQQVKDDIHWSDFFNGRALERGEVTFGHYYPRWNMNVRKQNRSRIDTFNHIKDRWVPTGVRNYGMDANGIGHGGLQASIVGVVAAILLAIPFGPWVAAAAGAAAIERNQYTRTRSYNWEVLAYPLNDKKKSRLTRCRSIPDYLDPDFQIFDSSNNYNVGLKAQIREPASIEFAAPHNEMPYIFRHQVSKVHSNRGPATITDDWARRHDFCPLGQGERHLTCTCDGAMLSRAMDLDVPPANEPISRSTGNMFADFSFAHGCYNLDLFCEDFHRFVCVDFRIKWNKRNINKYNPGKDAAGKLWGPIAADTYGMESVCLPLRQKNEGVDGYNTNSFIGNGFCDCQYNNEQWGYDGGDCCPSTCDPNPQLPGSCVHSAWNRMECKQPGCVTAAGTVVPPPPARPANLRRVRHASAEY